MINKNLMNQLESYEKIFENLKVHLYWKDKNFRFLNCNDAQAISAGFTNKSNIIGKTDYEMLWYKEASLLRQMDSKVMHTKQTIICKEISKIADTEKISIFLSKKTPLFDKTGNVIGIAGISFDITEYEHKTVEDRPSNNHQPETTNFHLLNREDGIRINKSFKIQNNFIFNLVKIDKKNLN